MCSSGSSFRAQCITKHVLWVLHKSERDSVKYISDTGNPRWMKKKINPVHHILSKGQSPRTDYFNHDKAEPETNQLKSQRLCVELLWFVSWINAILLLPHRSWSCCRWRNCRATSTSSTPCLWNSTWWRAAITRSVDLKCVEVGSLLMEACACCGLFVFVCVCVCVDLLMHQQRSYKLVFIDL